MVICQTVGLSKTYNQSNYQITAIKNCNLKFTAGECIAICGSRTSGKSTLLRMLCGLERPTDGVVYIKNKNITEYSDDELAIMRRNEIGYLNQNNSLIPELTIHENIIMPSILAHNKYDETYYKDLIEHLQLKEYLSCRPKQLTEHQRYLVNCARALINNPSIILFDEPYDQELATMNKSLLDYLLNLVYMKGKTLIMVMDDSEINIFMDHIIRLENGEVVENRRIS